MALPNDPTNQAPIYSGIVAILIGIGAFYKWLRGGNNDLGELPVKAEIIARDNKMIIEIPIEAVLKKQDEVLADLRRDTSTNGSALARVEGTVDAIKKQLDDSGPWAQSVERRFQEHSEKLAIIKGDVDWLKSKARKFDGD